MAAGETQVKKAPLPWLLAGLLLGLVQVAAVWAYKPLGVSPQFVVADARIIGKAAPDYARGLGVLSEDRYQKLGYEWWLVVGLVIGAFIAAVGSGRWRVQATCAWWRASRGKSAFLRLIVCFVGGFLLLFVARLADGCTSGQFASGWAQLSLAAVPFTVTMFGFAVLTASVVYRESPGIEQ